jgi:hypothetical protein
MGFLGIYVVFQFFVHILYGSFFMYVKLRPLSQFSGSGKVTVYVVSRPV